jgi:hypothetical protein
MTINQGQENAILNKALSPVPFPHLTGAELNADIVLGTRTFNTIDANNVAWILTDIQGWLTTPEPEFPEVSRGIQGDGDYDVDGRYKARIITLAGSLLVPDRTYIPAAQQDLIDVVDLVRRGVWLKFLENPTRAVFVRLSGQPQIQTMNPRGRIDFSIGLKAADPLKYEWNEDRSDGYFLANVKASNYDGSETGAVSITNNGNYDVSAIYEITGPIIGPGASIFNNANSDLIEFAQPLRPARNLTVSNKSMTNGVVTLTLNTVSDLQAGDELMPRFVESRTVSQATRTSGSSLVTITTSGGHGFSTGDTVVLSGVNSDINGTEYSITRVNTTAFTFTSGATTAISNTTGTAFNITNDRYNGTFTLDSVDSTNNKVTYTTIYNETYASATAFSAVAYRSPDVLEIDTYSQEVALNGETYQQRSKLATLVDWMKLKSGANEITLDDSNQEPIYVYKVSQTNTTATLTTATEHGFNVTDVVLVDNVPALSNSYDTAVRQAITSYSQSGTAVTLNVTGHGYSAGDLVVISGVDAETIDGEYTIATVATNSFTVTSASSATTYTTSLPTGSAYVKKILKISHYSRSSFAAYIYTTTTHGLSVGDYVDVFGVPSGFDGFDGLQQIVAVDSGTNLITLSTRTEATVANTNVTGGTITKRFPITAVTPYSFSYVNGGTTNVSTTTVSALVSSEDIYSTPSSITKDTNVVTVVTTRPHGYTANNLVQVENVGAGFNVGTGDPVAIANVSRSGTTVTVRTAAAHSLIANDIVQVYGTSVTETDVSLNGTYSVLATSNNTHFTYTTQDTGTVATQTQERAFAAKKVRVAYYTKNASTSNAYSTTAGNVVWFYTKTNHGLATGDSVYVENLSSSLNGLQGTVTNVNATFFRVVSNNISLVTTANITSAAGGFSGNMVRLRFDAPHGLSRDDSIWVNSNTNSSINGPKTVAFIYDATAIEFDNGTTATGTLNNTTRGKVGRHYETSSVARAYPITNVINTTAFTYFSQEAPATNATNQINGTTSNAAGEVVLNGDGRMSVYYRSGWIA